MWTEQQRTEAIELAKKQIHAIHAAMLANHNVVTKLSWSKRKGCDASQPSLFLSFSPDGPGAVDLSELAVELWEGLDADLCGNRLMKYFPEIPTHEAGDSKQI